MRGVPFNEKKMDEIKKRIREGWTCRQIAQKMEDVGRYTIEKMISLGYKGIDRYKELAEAKLNAPENRGKLNGSGNDGE